MVGSDFLGKLPSFLIAALLFKCFDAVGWVTGTISSWYKVVLQ